LSRVSIRHTLLRTDPVIRPLIGEICCAEVSTNSTQSRCVRHSAHSVARRHELDAPSLDFRVARENENIPAR
jgi:hypothetical protein